MKRQFSSIRGRSEGSSRNTLPSVAQTPSSGLLVENAGQHPNVLLVLLSALA